jgi:hypothetical protein
MKKNLGALWLAVIVAVLASAVRGTGAVRATEITLVSAEAVFETTTNDKDHDSLVTVTVKRGNTVIAAASNIGGHWNDHSTHAVNLDVGGGWTRSELASRTKTELSMATNGNDKWEFNYVLRLNWSDGTRTEQRFDGLVLTQDDPFKALAVGL